MTRIMTLVEACCDSVQTARAAQQFGAGRIELCGLGDGGTTPSLGTIAACREALTVPIHVMIRPHTNGFVYDADDMQVMCNDIIAAKTWGADGVVLGPLNSDGSVCAQQLVEFVAMARPMKVAFHRAFDQTPDPLVALDAMLAAGVNYILTAGHAATALEGASRLRALQAHAGDALVVLAGGNVRGHNVTQLLETRGVREVHVRATDPTIVRDVVRALATHTFS